MGVDTQRRGKGGWLQPSGGELLQRARVRAPGVQSVLLLVAILSLGCGTSPVQGEGVAPISLLPPGATCTGSTLRIPLQNRVPLRIEHIDASILTLVPLCVDGHGPFPFVLDTGAPSTLFDTHFLDFVRLGADAPPEILHQPGCATVLLHVSVPRWSVGPVGLNTQSVAVVRMPGFGLSGQPMGLLGSDVLSRFGAIRIDYLARLLTVAGPEGPPPSPGGSVNGPTADTVPPDMLSPGTGTPIPVDVTTSASGTSVVAPVSFGTRGPFLFDVASGAPVSEASAQLAARLGLAKTGRSLPVTSLGCPRDGQVVASGPWASGSVPLRSGPIVAALSETSSPGAEGLIGSKTLSARGSFVLDYRSGSLVLGAGS